MSEKEINKNVVNNPAHYTAGGIECIDAIEAATTGLRGVAAVCVGNVIKYVWRYSLKNGLEDLYKADFYLTKLINKVREENEKTKAKRLADFKAFDVDIELPKLTIGD